MVCGFTGHRRLPWGGDETDPRCAALKTVLGRRIAEAAAAGCGTFLCGMARGADTYFAEAVLALRDGGLDLRLEALVPCPSQAGGWPAADRDRWTRLLAACDAVTVLEPAYTPDCMLRRNRVLVDRSDVLITVYDGSGGGTASTVAYARRRGRPLLPVWL